ncbi:MAG: type IV secretion system DNA-binding domain-containing protein [Defluviitaleaceae bacterium]|nr:type IV secretion system DNA-binding domain-containing protein [Defluviitaleaceae bacterium]
MKKIRLSKKNTIPRRYNNNQDGTLVGHAGRRPVYILDDAKHVFICGTTGSGKSVCLSNFIKTVLEKDYPAVILEGKGDTGKGSILDILQTMKKELNPNKKIYVINLSDPKSSDHYNPFKNASPTVAKDMLINMTDWSEEHYKSNVERYIQRILQLLEIGNFSLSFKRIIKCMPTDNFLTLSNKLLEKGLITKEQHLDNVDVSITSGKIAQTSIARFSNIAEGEAGCILSDKGVDISQALKENAIILFILNPLTFPELSPAFGRLVLIDAKKAVGELFKSSVGRTFFLMDEISVYASTALTDLVNKSRSANVTCVLATQSLSDLDKACGEAYKEQIIENCNNYILMRQNSGVNAEHWANILGTRATIDVTYQLQARGFDTSETGFGSARRTREYLFHPDDIKSLQTGKGIFLSRDTGISSRINVNKPF